MKKNSIEQIQKIKDKLEYYKEENSKAKAQEEMLLKQLKEEFDVDSLDEAMELYDELVEENEEREEMINDETESLIKNMQKDKLL